MEEAGSVLHMTHFSRSTVDLNWKDGKHEPSTFLFHSDLVLIGAQALGFCGG